MTLIYLGQPYTDPDPHVMTNRYAHGRRAAASLFSDGLHVYAPIVAWHDAAKVHQLPTDWKRWRDQDLDFLERCDELYVLCLDGWAGSQGLSAEIAYATDHNMPITMLSLNSEGSAQPVTRRDAEGHWSDVADLSSPPSLLLVPDPEPAEPRNILDEAERAVYGDRARDYGHPRDNFRRIAELWSAFLSGRGSGFYPSLTGEETALMMALVKIARLQETPDHRDSWVDIAG